MKLSELETSSKIKVLLIGASGSGKTCAAAGMPGTTYIFDFDNKASSASAYFRHKDPGRLNQIELDQFPLNKDLGTYQKFKTKLQELEFLAAKNAFPYENIVVDSLTLYLEALKNVTLASRADAKRIAPDVPALQDFMVMGIRFTEDMNRILSLPANIIATAHSTTKTDQITDALINAILLPGKTADHLPRIFNEVYWAFARSTPASTAGGQPKIEHVALTRSNGSYTCRTEIPTLPAIIPLDFKVVLEHMGKTKKNTP